jgi:hypothetical protein
MGAQARLALVLAANPQSGLMEGTHRRPRGRRERQVKTGAGRCRTRPQFQANQILTINQSIADDGCILVYPSKPKRAQGRVIEGG